MTSSILEPDFVYQISKPPKIAYRGSVFKRTVHKSDPCLPEKVNFLGALVNMEFF